MKPSFSIGAVLAGGLLLCALGLSACGDDDDDSGQPSSGGQPSAGGAGDEMPASGGGDAATLGGAAETGGAGGAAPGTGACDLPVIGSWKAGGETFEVQTGLFIPLDEAFNFTMVACGGSDATMQFETIPALEPGSYPLTFTILHGHPANGDAGALYTDPDEKNYFTDEAHTGTFQITAVDETARTFSADFAFTGKADDGATVEITEGHIVDAKY